MKQVTFKVGALIYREGDDSDAVHFITKGRVEVSRLAEGYETTLAVLGRGQIFGESGVIRGVKRSTTVRADTDVTLQSIPKDKFLDAFSLENPLALSLLRMLCQRLSDVDRQVSGDTVKEPAEIKRIEQVRLLPASETVQKQIGNDGILIGKIPYRVGRRANIGDPPLRTAETLYLRTDDSYQLSPEQFAIEQRDGHLIAHDLGSHLGTLVNGVRLARFEHGMTAGLHFGENTIQSGGIKSPYHFTLFIDLK